MTSRDEKTQANKIYLDRAQYLGRGFYGRLDRGDSFLDSSKFIVPGS
jgi:hypothetical protein